MTAEFVNVIGSEEELGRAGSSLWKESDGATGENDRWRYRARAARELASAAATERDRFRCRHEFLIPVQRAPHDCPGKLTGVLRCSWSKADVELYAGEGKVMLVTTSDPDLYCGETPITLVNVDSGRLEQARESQRKTGVPMFMMLMRDDPFCASQRFNLSNITATDFLPSSGALRGSALSLKILKRFPILLVKRRTKKMSTTGAEHSAHAAIRGHRRSG